MPTTTIACHRRACHGNISGRILIVKEGGLTTIEAGVGISPESNETVC